MLCSVEPGHERIFYDALHAIADRAIPYVIITPDTADGISPYDAQKLVAAFFAFLSDAFSQDREPVLAGIPGSCEDPFILTILISFPTFVILSSLSCMVFAEAKTPCFLSFISV